METLDALTMPDFKQETIELAKKARVQEKFEAEVLRLLNSGAIDPDDAKEKAREWYKGPGFCFAWLDESVASIEAFCERFGVRLTSYSCSLHEPYSFTTDVDNDCFRGLCLNQFDRDHMPTGYALDCALWQTFVDEWQRTGSARIAFTLALEAAFEEWREDLEYQLTNESVDDNIIANEYEFTVDGARYCPPKEGTK